MNLRQLFAIMPAYYSAPAATPRPQLRRAPGRRRRSPPPPRLPVRRKLRMPLMSDQIKRPVRVPIQLQQPDKLVASIAQDAVATALGAVPVVGPILNALVAPVLAGAFVDTYAPIDDPNNALFQRGGRGNEGSARVRTSPGNRVLRE